MLRVGQVIHVSPTNSKRVVIKAEKVPPVGAKVTYENGKLAGFVFDVFGSTSSPYIEIESRHCNNSSAIGQTLFYKRPFKSKKKGQRRKR